MMVLSAIAQKIKQRPCSLYFIHGDEPLLAKQARELIISETKRLGFQRELYCVQPGFDWNILIQRQTNQDLFSQNILLDLRIPLAKLDQQSTSAIGQFLVKKQDQIRLMISTEKLTAAQQQTSWYKTFDENGLIITLRPIPPQMMPQWITEQLQQYGLSASKDAILWLVHMTHGHLLATYQAIEKCHLLATEKIIDLATMMTATVEQTQFSIYQWVDFALAADLTQTIRAVETMKANDIEPTLALWALNREIRQLMHMHDQLRQGQSMATVLQKTWASRRPLLQQALSRLTWNYLSDLLQYAAVIDKMIKGILPGNSWNALRHMSLALSGHLQTIKTDIHEH